MSRLLAGHYGTIRQKHKDLALFIFKRQPELDTVSSVSDYIADKSKYKNWTLRDIDKALAYSTTLSSY